MLGDTAKGRTSALQVITVTSGKGGVGKSSLAVNLGITLARQGRRVCIFDADAGLANVNILLGLPPERGLDRVLAGECPIEDVLQDGPHGLRVVPGASGISDCVALDAVHQRRLVSELARIEQDFDYLLLDTAAGVSETTLDFVSAGHRILLVITPEPTSLTDAFSLLKLSLRRQVVRCDVVVNMVRDGQEARQIYQRFDAAVRRYLNAEMRMLGFVQRDESLRSAVALQRPVALFADGDPSRRPFERLADGLEQTPAGVERTQSFSRFWFRRFMRLRDGEADVAQAVELDAAPRREHPASTPGPESAIQTGESESESTADGPSRAAVMDKAAMQVHRHRLLQAIEAAGDAETVKACLRELIQAASRRFGPEVAEDLLTTADDGLSFFPDPEEPIAAPDPGPDFASPAAPAERQLNVLAETPEPPDPALPPPEDSAFDSRRFGAQEALARRLRELDAGTSVMDFIRRLAP
ncbi:MinD/ParA family protein [Methylonatrum kenyense]|uniref:MinD/ParA family protein n=1 Tax=Methylonatrum kenyense TaxID=455253 RepID=UPI0020BDC82B|nr:MinD/ParA family protein [Methylonatrum kenyense]MCK8517203.1 MinD/ParA family protein [Methylonatrum kenyense]